MTLGDDPEVGELVRVTRLHGNDFRVEDMADTGSEPVLGEAPHDLLEHAGDARLVLLGEATHGTSDFYRMRSRITRELITRKGLSFVGIEGDWPDVARIDCYVRARSPSELWMTQQPPR
ncbi:hypothetical protein ASE11_12630 [Hydrogenophaga sp. Root209]|nr:hypothetical protein ASE11_12630 [Hydrogenophaga sp. Root209]